MCICVYVYNNKSETLSQTSPPRALNDKLFSFGYVENII